MPLETSSTWLESIPDWVSALAAVSALAVSIFAFLTSKIALQISKNDSEFQNCFTLRLKAIELWETYSLLQNKEIEFRSYIEETTALLNILGHIEWVLIYTKSRGKHCSAPIQNLKSETMRPIIKLLSSDSDNGAFLVETIIKNKDSQDTFSEIMRELKKVNISIYSYLARNSK